MATTQLFHIKNSSKVKNKGIEVAHMHMLIFCTCVWTACAHSACSTIIENNSAIAHHRIVEKVANERHFSCACTHAHIFAPVCSRHMYTVHVVHTHIKGFFMGQMLIAPTHSALVHMRKKNLFVLWAVLGNGVVKRFNKTFWYPKGTQQPDHRCYMFRFFRALNLQVY